VKPLERTTKYMAMAQYMLYKSANVCGRGIQRNTRFVRLEAFRNGGIAVEKRTVFL